MSGPLATLLREALFLALLVAAPPVLAAVAAGLVAAFLQSAARIEERSLGTVARIVAALAALALASPWIADELTRFTTAVLTAIPTLGRR